MLDEWEEFAGGPTPPRGERLHVSLNHKGQILLNKNAVEALGAPGHVILLIEKRNSKIGIRPASAGFTNAFPLRSRLPAHSRMIMASPFCRNYGIRVTGTVAFHNIDIDRDGMMTLDLAKTSRVSRVTG